MSFSCDGQTLASASYDDTIKLWNLNLDSLMAKSCDLVRGYLTHNPNVSERDRHLGDGIGTQQNSLPFLKRSHLRLVLNVNLAKINPKKKIQMLNFLFLKIKGNQAGSETRSRK